MRQESPTGTAREFSWQFFCIFLLFNTPGNSITPRRRTMLWCVLSYQGLLLPSVSRPLCPTSAHNVQRHAPAVIMGDKPSKFEEDAAAFAAGIFKVADNAKAAAKLKKLEEEVG